MFSINSPEECIKKCYHFNFRYAGVQNGYQCWCGDKYGKYGLADRNNCSKYCPTGNKTCGGKYFNDVYEINNLSIFKNYFLLY
jgi:hypothetical protein